MNDAFVDISSTSSHFDDDQLEVGINASVLPPDSGTAGSAEDRFWETIRRAEASFDKHGRASRRFHQAKRSVDKSLRRLGDADQRSGPSLSLSPSPSPSLVLEERRPAYDGEEDEEDEEDSPSAQVAALYAGRGKNSSSSSCPTREARLKAGEAQIALIIDAMEARATRVEQLAEEMERLFIDTQNLLCRMTGWYR